MYHLRVIHQGSPVPAEIVCLRRATEVLAEIPNIIHRHGDCDRIEVLAGTTPLFAVDSQGHRLAD